MSRAATTSSANLVSTITGIYQEVVMAEEEHARMLTAMKNLAALQTKLQATLDNRTSRIAELLEKSVTVNDLAKLVGKIRAIEAASNSALLKVQMSMQRENQMFTTVSNVLKTRHDTVKNSIGNIR